MRGRMHRCLTRHWRRLRDQDDGVSMMEITVSLAIMSILMTMVTTAVLQVYTATNRTESITTSQAQLNNLFLRLDKEIRYAAGVSREKEVTVGTWWVEYLVAVNGVPTCTQLRLTTTTTTLEKRTWVKDQTPFAPTAWRPLATNVTAPAGQQPFTFLSADPSGVGVSPSNFDRLQISLVARALGNPTVTDAGTTITFTALNTTPATSTGTMCTEGRAFA
jgi:prepilin-type N-terminal cleavage/methylation domain-containing protein